MNQKLGSSIKILRELNNLTQNYVAQHLDISQAAYQKIEADRTQPRPCHLQQLSTLFDVPTERIGVFSKENILNKLLYVWG
jgi:transcriptional regulator with XRE-family HTH domain